MAGTRPAALVSVNVEDVRVPASIGAEKVAVTEITADGDWPPPGLPYPVVLKPAEGVASEDVALAETPGALAERCAEYFGRFPDGRLVAEEYLPGTLRTLETLGDGRSTWVLGGFRTNGQINREPARLTMEVDWQSGPNKGITTVMETPSMRAPKRISGSRRKVR